MPQDPTGSAASSSSSSSDLAESDERNDEDGGGDDDEDDDGTTPTSLTTGIATDQASNNKRDEDQYENQYESVVNDETCALEYFGIAYDAHQRSAAPAMRDRYHRRRSECVETALTSELPVCCELRDSGSSDSASSLDDLCGHRRPAAIRVDGDDERFDDRRHEVTNNNNNARDHYMIPTWDPRELNERILSLFNPQFLPNFNDMITYVAARSPPPPPRSQSMAQNGEDDDLLLRDASYRKRGSSTNSMCLRRGLTYETPRK